MSLLGTIDQLRADLARAEAKLAAVREMLHPGTPQFAFQIVNHLRALLAPSQGEPQALKDNSEAFLSRALAQSPDVPWDTANPGRCSECDPSFGCFDGSAPCSKAPVEQPAAPAQAELVPGTMHEELRQVMLGERRARESAEAKLAAVQGVARQLRGLAVEFRLNPQVHSTYSECASRIERALLAPSQGEAQFRCGSCRDTGKWSTGIVCPACGGASVVPSQGEGRGV